MLNMKKPLTVSIIIPVYNEEDYIKQCLDHIAAQTVAPDEVIVVDNNSTDKTLKLAREYKFVTIMNEKKQGVLYARTKGFNQAKSQIIGRIDADSRLEPDWVEQLHRVFKESSIDGVTGSSHWYDMPLSPWNHNVENVFKYNLYQYEKDFPFLFGTNMAIRKSAWNEVKPFLCQDKYIHEDSDIAIHMHLTGHRLLYDKSLRAGMSGRRSQDSVADFKKYIDLCTFFLHLSFRKRVGKRDKHEFCYVCQRSIPYLRKVHINEVVFFLFLSKMKFSYFLVICE